MRLTLSYTILGTKKLGKALTVNLSGEGLRFIAEHPLEPGTRLEIVLRLPEGEEPVRCLAEVVWSQMTGAVNRALPSHGAEVGARFVEIRPPDLALIAQYAAFYFAPAHP